MYRINNIRLPSPSSIKERALWSILVDQESIVHSIDLMPLTSSRESCISWDGDWLSPMAIDLQINGGLGIEFNQLSGKKVSTLFNLLDKLWLEGVDAICPTLVTSEISQIRNSLEVLHQARKSHSSQACKILGAHLEGPFLSKEYFGAHNSNYLLSPTLENLEKIIEGYEEDIALVTLAPELPRADEVIKELRRLGIIVSLGHSAANSDISSRAFQQGVSMITHAFNAMPGIHHRFPGPLVEAMINGEIAIGLIADGIHVDPKVIQIIQKLVPDKIFLVSDALSPYGLSGEKFFWGEKPLNVNDNVCKLEDGTLAGTTLPLLEACIRMAKWTKQFSTSIWATTVSGRVALGRGKTIQDFIVGKSLNQLLRWHLDSASEQLTWNHAK
ncbi:MULTISPECIES: N-acetylglucosamine-6-phosphate deacetylase [Prochlorococcus]|uniref:N-acetylglucosamine-6-phosphate deacetylase n=1 Tax=Prochlorococcus TaxID=1218 RepID=UPI0005337583|nr:MULTISPECIES: N-acetylglucosamine-6-phosphate deacetylase [Prochlorococcus]KGG13205.1 N-acetylglucosamine-6-phosphate deacetylase [Prochlorococcus sp. MIT 0601]